MKTKEKRLGAIILAAGNSSRLNRPKQLLIWENESLVHRAARLAIEVGCDPVTVVTGAFHEEVEAALADLPTHQVWNKAWQKGMGYSLEKGIEAIQNGILTGHVACL